MTAAPSLRQLLDRVASGEVSAADAEALLLARTAMDLGDAVVDTEREARRGRAETIFGQGKSLDQIRRIAQALADAGQNVLATRLSTEAMEALRGATMAGVPWQVNVVARTAFLPLKPVGMRRGTVAVVSAGTTDLPVAEEACVTLAAFGSPVDRITDVGVAGLHRLLRVRPRLEAARVVVVVAGMEGALPSVVAGLVKAPLVAVPTSVGYGASFGGMSALLTMLTACAPGIGVVNIDNGFGAGYLADVINALGDNAPGGTG